MWGSGRNPCLGSIATRLPRCLFATVMSVLQDLHHIRRFPLATHGTVVAEAAHLRLALARAALADGKRIQLLTVMDTAGRSPRRSLRHAGGDPERRAERLSRALTFQPPPRSTRASEPANDSGSKPGTSFE